MGERVELLHGRRSLALRTGVRHRGRHGVGQGLHFVHGVHVSGLFAADDGVEQAQGFGVGGSVCGGRAEVDTNGGVLRGSGVAGGVGVGHVQRAAVQHHVARNSVDAQALHAAQQQPQALQHQLGVALAFDVQVAKQRALAHRAFQILPRLRDRRVRGAPTALHDFAGDPRLARQDVRLAFLAFQAGFVALGRFLSVFLARRLPCVRVKRVQLRIAHIVDARHAVKGRHAAAITAVVND